MVTQDVVLTGLQIKGAKMTAQGMTVEIEGQDTADIIRQLLTFRDNITELIAQISGNQPKTVDTPKTVDNKEIVEIVKSVLRESGITVEDIEAGTENIREIADKTLAKVRQGVGGFLKRIGEHMTA